MSDGTGFDSVLTRMFAGFGVLIFITACILFATVCIGQERDFFWVWLVGSSLTVFMVTPQRGLPYLDDPDEEEFDDYELLGALPSALFILWLGLLAGAVSLLALFSQPQAVNELQIGGRFYPLELLGGYLLVPLMLATLVLKIYLYRRLTDTALTFLNVCFGAAGAAFLIPGFYYLLFA